MVQTDRLTHLETKQNSCGQVLSHIAFYWVGFSSLREVSCLTLFSGRSKPSWMNGDLIPRLGSLPEQRNLRKIKPPILMTLTSHKSRAPNLRLLRTVNHRRHPHIIQSPSPILYRKWKVRIQLNRELLISHWTHISFGCFLPSQCRHRSQKAPKMFRSTQIFHSPSTLISTITKSRVHLFLYRLHP